MHVPQNSLHRQLPYHLTNELLYCIYIRNNDLTNAAFHNDISYIRSKVANGVSPDSLGLGGTTPLMMAVQWGLWKIVDYLLEEGADINIVDDNGESALSLAYEYYPDSPIVDKLIHAGADVNISGNCCLLKTAIWNRDISMLQKLLRIPTTVIPTYAGCNPIRNCDLLLTEEEIQTIFEDAYALPIGTRTRGKQGQYQWRKLLINTHTCK